jgi:uncharacterized FAD-dependent dehydrogenase
LSSTFETNVPGIYVIGEASGVTGNMLEDAASGIIVAQDS